MVRTRTARQCRFRAHRHEYVPDIFRFIRTVESMSWQEHYNDTHLESIRDLFVNFEPASARSPWTMREDILLRRLYAESSHQLESNNSRMWLSVAVELNMLREKWSMDRKLHRSPRVCERRCQDLVEKRPIKPVPARRRPVRWSHKEIEMMVHVLSHFRITSHASAAIPWVELSACIPGRSSSICKSHYATDRAKIDKGVSDHIENLLTCLPGVTDEECAWVIAHLASRIPKHRSSLPAGLPSFSMRNVRALCSKLNQTDESLKLQIECLLQNGLIMFAHSRYVGNPLFIYERLQQLRSNTSTDTKYEYVVR